MDIEDFECTRNSPVSSVYYSTSVVGLGAKLFKPKALRQLENTILILAIPNTVFHKIALLLIFEEEFSGSVL